MLIAVTVQAILLKRDYVCMNANDILHCPLLADEM